MYAIIETGGKQYMVREGMKITIEKLANFDQESNKENVIFDKVLLVNKNEDLTLGAPYIAKASVVAEFIQYKRTAKIRIIKFKRRKHHLKRANHRQMYAEFKILNINY